MFIGNSYIPSLLNVFLKTSLFLEFLWWLYWGWVPYFFREKWPLSLQFWKLFQTMEPRVPKPFHIQISFKQNRERKTRVCALKWPHLPHQSTEHLFYKEHQYVCSIQDVLLASFFNITTNKPAFIWYGLAGSKCINSTTCKILRSWSAKPL